jgi:soluble epoxide hydrolase/lipid-phosphate phosphatase
MVIWRTVLWHPELVSHVFSVCTTYDAPKKEYLDLESLVKNVLPQFGYQIHLASGEVEKHVNTRESIRNWLSGMYGARGPNRETVFTPKDGVLFENIPKVAGVKCPLLSDEVTTEELFCRFSI